MTALVARHAVARSGPAKVWVLAGLGATFAGLFIANFPNKGIIALAVLGVAIAMFVRPDTTTLVVLFLITINAPSVLVTKYGVPQAAGAVVPILLLIPLAMRLLRRQPLVATGVCGLLLLYLLVELIGTVISPDTSISLKHVETFVLEGLLSYFLVTNVIRTKAEVRRATWVVLWGLGVLGGLSLIQSLSHHYFSTFFGFAHTSDDFFYGQVTSPRFQGPIGDPNYFAEILVIGVPLGLSLAASSRAWKRAAALVLTGLCLAGIVLTYSRGAVVALAFVLIGMVALRVVRARFLLLAIVGLSIAIASIPSYRARVSSLGAVQGASAQQGSSSASSDQSVRERSTELRAALLAFSDHPVLGVGPSAFPLVYQHYALQTGGEVHSRIKYGPLKGTIPERQAHDLFLSVATDGGIVGLTVFVAMIIAAWRSLLRGRRLARKHMDMAGAALVSGYVVAMVGFLTAGLFLSLAYERYYWLLLALATAAGRSVVGEQAAAAAAAAAAVEPAPPKPPRPPLPPPVVAARGELVRLLLRIKRMSVEELARALEISVADAEGLAEGRTDIARRAEIDRVLALGANGYAHPFYAVALTDGAGVELGTAGGTPPLFADPANADRVGARVKRVAEVVVVVPVVPDFAWQRFVDAQAAEGREAETRSLFLADQAEIEVERDEILHELGEAMAAEIRLRVAPAR